MSGVPMETEKSICIIAGSDDNGLFVCWEPGTRLVYCILILYDGDWKPFKFYRNNKSKTKKRAKQHLKYYRKTYINDFKVEEVWETVPVEEMEKTYYEKTNQIVEDIKARSGFGRVVVGFRDRRRNLCFVEQHNHTQQEVLREILESTGPEGTKLYIDPAERELGEGSENERRT